MNYDFSVIGYSSDSSMTAFVNGTASIAEGGSMFEEGTTERDSVISEELAIFNDLSVGDTIILADEPTGNLDTETQNDIMGIFRELAVQGKCVILVSHSPEVASMCDERYELVKISRKKH